MIQRIQTIYLLLAAILLTVCACLPIGTFVPTAVGIPSEMYNISIINGDTGTWDFSGFSLFMLLVAAAAVTVMNVFNYHNRKKQKNYCNIAILVAMLWIADYFISAELLCPEGMEFKYGFAAALPFFAIILIWLARKGIIHDENLIKAADRIR